MLELRPSTADPRSWNHGDPGAGRLYFLTSNSTFRGEALDGSWHEHPMDPEFIKWASRLTRWFKRRCRDVGWGFYIDPDQPRRRYPQPLERGVSTLNRSRILGMPGIDRQPLVWVPGWEFECCGEEFAVGDVVQWTATMVLDDYFVGFLGEALGSEVKYRESHHLPVDAVPLTGRVLSIRSVCCPSGVVTQADPALRDVRTSDSGPDVRATGVAVVDEVASAGLPLPPADRLDFRGWLVVLDC